MTTSTTPDDAAAAERPKLIRTYRTRAYLSRAGHVRLDDVLAQQCLLYNAALEERRTAWKGHQKSISFAEQSRSLTAIRKDFPDIEGSLHRRIQDATLKRLDRAFAAFHRRAQAGEAPGHPRFKSSRRWKTLEMYSGNARCVFVDESTGKGLVRQYQRVCRFCVSRTSACHQVSSRFRFWSAAGLTECISTSCSTILRRSSLSRM